MTGESAVRVAAILPDVLGTYSDSGNARVLAQRLLRRGIPVEVTNVLAGDAPPVDCDLYLLGGGEDAAQVYAAGWLCRHPSVCAAMRERVSTLAVCAGLQVLGRWFEDTAGRRYRGAEVVDVVTRPGGRRAVGEVVSRCTLPDVGLLLGFENHRGLTTPGPGVPPLGYALRGVGNGDERRGEGIATRTVTGTYLHGPVLARNPALADALLAGVVGSALDPLELPDQAAVRSSRLGIAARLRCGRAALLRPSLR